MMETHPHLVNWVPLAIPFRSWIMWEPVLDHPLFMILPLICPIFTKFYDWLSGFHCPPSALHHSFNPKGKLLARFTLVVLRAMPLGHQQGTRQAQNQF